MIKSIVKKDLYSNFQDTKIQVLSVAVLCISLVVTLLGVFEYKIKNDRYHVEQAANLELLYKNKVYATIHPKAIKMPAPLAVLNKGAETNFGNSYTFEMLAIPYQADKIYEENAYINSFISLDLSVVFIWFFSLIPILIAYDSVVKEREDGTIKLMFASRLSKPDFYISKILTSILSVLFIMLISMFVILIIFLCVPWIEFDFQTGCALFLFFLLTLIYSIFWIAIGTVCSIIFKSSAQSLVASLAVWVLLLIVVPTSIKTIIGNTDFVNEKREIETIQKDIMKSYYDQMGLLWNRDFAPLISQLKFETWGGGISNEPVWVANPATRDAAIKYYNTLNPLKKDIADKKFAIAEEKYLLPLKKKIFLLEKLANLSPVTIFEKVGTKISGTSYEDQFLFFDRFRIYRNQVIDFLMKREAFSSKRWFTPDDPYSPEHQLYPKNPDQPTEEELGKMRNYYSQRDSEKWSLDLNDFPIFNLQPKDLKAKNGFLPGFFVMAVLTCVVLAFGLYQINKYKIC
jgi:ABC-type transport system involved in multi-copper enzyme maturation permease subunit